MDLRARTSTIINIRIIQGPNKKHTLLSICWTFKNQATTNSCLLLFERSFHLSYYIIQIMASEKLCLEIKRLLLTFFPIAWMGHLGLGLTYGLMGPAQPYLAR